MIQKLSHVTLFVNNQDEAKDFYINKLGFEVRTDHTMEGGFRWLTVGPEDATGPGDRADGAESRPDVRRGIRPGDPVAAEEGRARLRRVPGRRLPQDLRRA